MWSRRVWFPTCTFQRSQTTTHEMLVHVLVGLFKSRYVGEREQASVQRLHVNSYNTLKKPRSCISKHSNHLNQIFIGCSGTSPISCKGVALWLRAALKVKKLKQQLVKHAHTCSQWVISNPRSRRTDGMSAPLFVDSPGWARPVWLIHRSSWSTGRILVESLTS